MKPYSTRSLVRSCTERDIIAILNTSGTAVVIYTYDAWGNILATSGSMASTLGTHNPLRYWGYVYDAETGLYYLLSRYYDPEVGRFVNADVLVSTGQGLLSNNMFAYCHNNPVNYYDESGREPVSISLFAIAGITICCIALVYLGANALAEFIEWISRQCSYSTVGISYASEEETEETLPRQGQVSEDPEAPPVDAGKQGKHVPGHNNYDDGKSSWPEGQNGVSQTQEAWQNGVPDPKVPSGNVKIGISSDGTVVCVHIDGKGFIHGYPIYPTCLP